MYYEIEYDAHPIAGVGKYVLEPQKIAKPPKDEIRDLFTQMRDIARAHPSAYDFTRSSGWRAQDTKAEIFYLQGQFMKDFTDDYPKSVPFLMYFPNYQMMGYEQLRAYFTWRSAVRKESVTDASLSYAFLYIYELLGNIGVNGPEEGLDRLMSFWKAYRVFNKSLDKYLLCWLKDYHIYYELPWSFKEFAGKNDLFENYPNLADSNDNFDLFCGISKYDIRKSAFYTDDKRKLITDCFYFVTARLRQVLITNGLHFDESIFQPAKKMLAWTPFVNALFYQWQKQADRRIVLSDNEIYICRENKWAYSTVITSESGRQLTGFILKQLESALRRVTNYRFKLTASINAVSHPLIGELKDAGYSLDSIINLAVKEFYREATKTVVMVNLGALSQIREESLLTQEKLIVPEQPYQIIPPAPSPQNLSYKTSADILGLPALEIETAPATDSWQNLKSALTEIEIMVLSQLWRKEGIIKKTAIENGIMLEVLFEGINEKALDIVGDNLVDEEFAIYDEYLEQVKELIG